MIWCNGKLVAGFYANYLIQKKYSWHINSTNTIFIRYFFVKLYTYKAIKSENMEKEYITTNNFFYKHE